MAEKAPCGIDDRTSGTLATASGACWELISDRVMGGVSQGRLTVETVDGRPAVRLRGWVSLANNGGFVQMAVDLRPDGAPVDAAGWQGLALDVWGNGEDYGAHLRTPDVVRPWQSYRQGFRVDPEWRTVWLPFAEFRPHRLEAPFDPHRLRRLGLVAIGREFEADLAVAGVRFW